jgi:methionyl aminopeptidase
MSIIIKNEPQIRAMREAGGVVARVLDLLKTRVEPGMTTRELDAIAEKETAALGAKPSFKGYRGYPGCLCVSINEEIVHGIPGERVIKDADVVSLDFGAIMNGYNADAAVTVAVGEPGLRARRLMEATGEALSAGIAAARSGGRLGDVSYAIQSYAEKRGFGVIREYSGHGIGKALHEDPLIPNVGQAGTGPELKVGMALAIEPMLTLGGWRTMVGADHWVVSTADGSLAAHFEHTVVVTPGRAEVLTIIGDGGHNG